MFAVGIIIFKSQHPLPYPSIHPSEPEQPTTLSSQDKKEDALMKMQAMMNSIQMAMSRLGGGVGGGGVK